MSGEESVPTFVYWDYSCPFSYVASHRLRRLAAELPLSLHWRPYEIHPGLPEEGIPAKELGYAPDQWARALREVEELAREEGIEVDVPDFVPSTAAPLQAALFARDVGPEAFGRLHRTMFRAYFVEGVNIGAPEETLGAAEQAGVDPDGLERALEDGRYEDDLHRVRQEAERYDIDGTPTALFGRFKVVGAAPDEVYRDAAARAAGEDAPEAGAGGGSGDEAG